MAEIAGPLVAETIDGEAGASLGTFFRHVLSGVLHRARILNPDSEGEATVFLLWQTGECQLYGDQGVLPV